MDLVRVFHARRALQDCCADRVLSFHDAPVAILRRICAHGTSHSPASAGRALAHCSYSDVTVHEPCLVYWSGYLVRLLLCSRTQGLTRRCSEPRPVLMPSFHSFMKSLVTRAVAALVLVRPIPICAENH